MGVAVNDSTSGSFLWKVMGVAVHVWKVMGVAVHVRSISALVTMTELELFGVVENDNLIPCSDFELFKTPQFPFLSDFGHDSYFDADGNGSLNSPPDQECP